MKTVGAENGVITASPPALEAKCAASLQAEIMRYGSLDAAIAGLWNDDCPELLNAALRLRSDRLADADPEFCARRLRTKAADERGTYHRHMDAYGDAIGRAMDRYRKGDTVLAGSLEREAKAALAEATECLKRAEAAEHEADRIESCGFVTLFDGVSARSAA